jgi:hypothetical protein
MPRTRIAAVLTLVTLLSVPAPAAPPLSISRLGTVATGGFVDGDPRIAEINAFDADGKRIFIVNPFDSRLDIVDASNPAALLPAGSVDLLADCTAALGDRCPLLPGLEPNSVAINGRLMAVAVANAVRTDNGHALLYRLRGANAPQFLTAIEVGALPDMVTFTKDGRFALLANEGEPSQDYTVDPLGSVSIIDVQSLLLKQWLGDWLGLNQFPVWNEFVLRRSVRLVTFERFNSRQAELEAQGVRIFGLNDATVAQDLEPEYIATENGKAFVTLQENNALAVIDIASGKVETIAALGLKNHSLPENELDPSDRDGAGGTAAVKLGTWPVFGLYMPDAIDAFTVKGKTFVITANEGDAREYGAYVEPLRIGSGSYVLDPLTFPNAAALKANAQLGRLNASTASGDLDGDGDFDRIEIFGGRSVSIRDAAGNLVWDSGDMFERIAEAQSAPGVTPYPTVFNTSNNSNATDNRSDDKGVEPEAVVVGKVRGRLYAFVGLERDGGIVVLDVSTPTAPTLVAYVNNRKFPTNAGGAFLGCDVNDCGDLGPEGLTFVPASDSPTRKALLIVTHEVSSTTTVWQID